MPKKIDHQQRRLELAEALWRLTRKRGWEAISLRSVAAEAGVSMGMVQHYFTTKDEMLRFAFEMIDEDVRSRIRSRIANLAQPHTPRRIVATVLGEMLPRPARRQTEADAAGVYIRRFMLRPESASRMLAGAIELQERLAEQIRLSRTTDATADAWREAAALIAILDGLILHIAIGQQSPDEALATLETELDHVFGSEPSSTG